MRNEELGIRNEGGGFAANVWGDARRLEDRSQMSDVSWSLGLIPNP